MTSDRDVPEPEDAEAELRQALAMLERGDGDPRALAAVTHRLAGLLAANGKLDDAIAAYERALELKREHLDPADPDRAVTLHDLAVLYATVGRDDDARALWTEARAALPCGTDLDPG